MAEHEQFFSFEEALKELRLKEEELKRLVSEGEIRAFREGDTMKLRRADVENLRSELSGGEVVDLGEVKEELVFEDDTGVAEEAGMATEEISGVETILEEPVVEEGLPTEDEIAIGEEAAEFVGVGEEEVEAGRPAAAATGRRAAPRVTIAAPEIEEVHEGTGVKSLIVLTTFILVLALPICLSIVQGRASGFAEMIANLFPHAAQ